MTLGGAGRGEIVQFRRSLRRLGFYSKRHGKPLEGFDERSGYHGGEKQLRS